MPRTDKRGRRVGGPPFLSLYFYMLESQAYMALKPEERAVLVQIAKRFRGTNNGTLAASVRDLAAECNIATGTVTRALRRLIELGFIDRVQEGSFSYKKRHAAEYRLTWHQCDKTGHKPSKLFMRWKPPVVASS